MSLKKDITEILDNIADILEFKGDNPFKIGAFRNGSNALRNVEEDLKTLVESGNIKNVKGVGSSIQSIVKEYVEKGSSSLYNTLLQEIPLGVLEFLKIRGLGIKKIRILVEDLGIRNFDELNKACDENKISPLKGFGDKTQELIKSEIVRISASRNRVLMHIAEAEVNRTMEKLNKIPGVKKVEVTGEFRRNLEIISLLEYVLLVEDLKLFLDENPVLLLDKKEVKLYSMDALQIEIVSSLTIPSFIYCTESKKDFPLILLYTTGSKEFVNNITFGKSLTARKDETEIFIKAGFPFIIPEMREKEYYSLKDELKGNSTLQINDLQGLLHFHTTYSDGKNTISEMVNAARDEGYKYAAICDHSKAAAYVSGLTEERVLQQKEEIKRVSKKLGFPIFHGIESDILKDGDLDYSDSFLGTFDFIVASVHSRFNLLYDEMTKRIIKAVESPYIDLLGHPTGRLLLSRAPVEVDIKKVIDACVANNTAIEINAYPNRLDLDWRYVYYAREKGCLLSINPDAHNTGEIRYVKYGVAVARKAGVQPEEVINCYDLKKFKKHLQRKINRIFE